MTNIWKKNRNSKYYYNNIIRYKESMHYYVVLEFQIGLDNKKTILYSRTRWLMLDLIKKTQ